jgi:hypothetical protein
MKQEMSPRDRRPDVSYAQVAGSALAAVSAAIVASFLGVGGTVLGAALGSVIATMGGAVYAHSFRRAGAKLSETKVLTVVTRSRAGHGEPGPGDVPLIEPASSDGERGPTPPYAESGPPGTTEEEEVLQEGPVRPRWMSWKTAALLAVAAFVIAMVVVSVVELTIGGPISGGSGGTTVTKLVHPGKAKHTKHTPAPTPTTPVVTPTSQPTTAVPTPTTPTPTVTATPEPTATTTTPVVPPAG